MADEELLGSGSIVISLDSAGAENETERLGDSIQRILDRASRRAAAAVQRNIRNGLRAIGTPSVQVTARLDDDALRARLDALQGAVVDVTARFDAAVVQAQLNALSGVTVDVLAQLDAASAEAAADRLGDSIERTLARAARDAGLRMQREINAAVRRITPVRVRVEADLRAFGHSIDTLQNFDPVPLPVAPDIDRARFEAAIQTVLDGLEASVRLIPDVDMSRVDAVIRAHHAPDLNVNVDVDRGLSRLSGALSGIGSAVGSALGAVARLGTAFAVAGAGAAVLGAALAPALGAVVALPAVALGAAAAVGALKLALSGVGDAFGAALTGSAEDFAKSLEKLSPAAQSAAREVRALKPQFDALKASVQDAFFAPLEGQISGVAKALGGPLKSGLASIAGNFGLAAERVANFLKSTSGVNAVTGILKGTDQATKGLAAAIGPVVAGFVKLAGSVSTAFGASLGSGIANAGAQLGNFLSTLADSGAAVDLIKGAGAVFSQLGAIASNVGSVLASVFSAAGGAAGPLLGIIAAVTERLAAFFDSAAGSQLLVSVFGALRTAMAAVGPILDSLFATFASLAPVIGSALGAVAPLFTVLGGAVTQLLDAVGPLVTQLAGALVPVFSALVSAITPVIQSLVGAFLPILPPLISAVLTLVQAFTPLLGVLGGALAGVIGAVAPLLASLAGVVGQVAAALAPVISAVIGALVPAFAALVPAVAQVVAAVVPLVESLIAGLLPVLPPLTEAFMAIVGALVPLIPLVADLLANMAPVVQLIIDALVPVVQFAAAFAKWTVLNATVPLISGVVSALGVLIDVAGAVSSNVVGAVRGIVGGFQYLYSKGVQLFTALTTTVPALVGRMVGAAVGFFQALPGRALSAVSSIVGGLTGVFTSARNAVVGKVTSLVADAVRLVRELPGKAVAALSGLGGRLASAGAELINGFISGIKSKLGAVKDTLGGLTSKLTDWKGPRQLDRIILTPAGRAVVDGFIRGLESTYPAVRASLGGLTAQLAKAVDARKIQFTEPFLASLKAGTAQLKSLTAQRERLLDRIKKANEFAAQTAQSALQTGALGGLDAGPDGIKGLTFGLEQAAAKIRKFTAQINNLAKRGLRKDLLDQLIGLGPDQGAGLASTLSKATAAQLKDFNDAQKQLAASAKSFGNTSADILFDAGKQAGAGLLAGLKGQKASIEKLMLDIAKSMTRAIRNALGIRSPSRVMARIGVQTMEGLRLGVDDQLPSVARSALRAASALTDPFGAGVSAPRIGGRFGAAGTSTGGAAAGGAVTNSTTSTARTVTINQTINEVGNAEATAQRILNRLAASGVGL